MPGPGAPIFNKGRGEAQELEVQGMHDSAKEVVNLQVDTFPGQSRQVLPPGDRTIQQAQAVCPEAIALRQDVANVPGAELPKWVRAAGLRAMLRDGVLCLTKGDKASEDRPDRIHVPVHLRVPAAGTQADIEVIEAAPRP